MNILIVDDHEQNLYLLESLFKGNGHQVFTAPDGKQALDRVAAGGIDLVVTDILMPVMDGFQLCRKIKRNPALADIPLIFYTATYTSSQDETFALKIGADRFILKPCEPDVLITAVNEVLTSAQKKQGEVSGSLIEEEEAYKLYSERLVTKLEQKMIEAEKEIEARKKAETDLRNSRERLVEAQRLAGIGDFVWDTATGGVTGSDAGYELLGYDPDDVLNIDRIHTEIHHPDDAAGVAAWVRICIESGKKKLPPKEYRVIRKDGKVLHVRAVGRIEKKGDGQLPLVFATIQDITAHKEAEAEKETLLAQLHQAQKMESVGRLAAGVAHDYNNMLNVITGFAELALGKIAPGDSLHDDIEEILNAAARSREITRKLLTFARRQKVTPKVLNLNETIEGMHKMLGRVIGEGIQFSWHPKPGVWNIFMDPSQVDQVLVNLCVNAKDAIDKSGRILVETDNACLDAQFCARHPGCIPGDFVTVTVNDNGCGMDAVTRENIFEPFYTTKVPEKGTGLGLATVYGIVRQNNGFIRVISEPGQGTSFVIYLPRHDKDRLMS